MATSLTTDAKRSQKFSATYHEPLMEFLGCKFETTENHKSLSAAMLDRDCGVDLIIGKPNGSYMEYIPCASRVIEVLPNGRDYDCFSVRNERASGNRTEHQKLSDTTKPRPMYHIQTFVDNVTGTAKVAIVQTSDLFKFMATGATKTITCHDGTKFNLAKWVDLITAGIKIFVYKICAATGEVQKLNIDALKGAN